MKIRVIKNQISPNYLKIISNDLYEEPIDLNEILKEDNIKHIKIIVTKHSEDLDNKEKRLLDSLGGYSTQTRMLRYFFLFYILHIFTLNLLYFTTNIYPSHFYNDGYTLSVLFFILFSGLFSGGIGLLFDSIFTIIRLLIFSHKEKSNK